MIEKECQIFWALTDCILHVALLVISSRSLLVGKLIESRSFNRALSCCNYYLSSHLDIIMTASS